MASYTVNFQINTDVICQVRFQPKDPAVIVSVGKEHMAFWNFDKEGSKLEEKSKANFEVCHLGVVFIKLLINFL